PDDIAESPQPVGFVSPNTWPDFAGRKRLPDPEQTHSEKHEPPPGIVVAEPGPGPARPMRPNWSATIPRNVGWPERLPKYRPPIALAFPVRLAGMHLPETLRLLAGTFAERLPARPLRL